MGEVREHGLLDRASGLGLHGHACWPYDDDAEMRQALVDFLTDGLRLKQRLIYVGSGSVEELREDIGALPQRHALVEMGMLQILSLDDVYSPGEPTDPEEQLATYAAATEQALADRYTGLRVGAKVTALVDDPAGWSEHTRWEALADEYMATHPLAALCLYDARALPGEIVSDLTSVHPVAHRCGSSAPFRLYSGDDCLELEGEVDYFSAPTFRRALAAAAPPDRDTVLDLSRLRFGDHHAVMALTDPGPARLRLRNVPGRVVRIAQLLDVALPSEERKGDDVHDHTV
jgi:anti-anti-sigma regulatory factor